MSTLVSSEVTRNRTIKNLEDMFLEKMKIVIDGIEESSQKGNYYYNVDVRGWHKSIDRIVKELGDKGYIAYISSNILHINW